MPRPMTQPAPTPGGPTVLPPSDNPSAVAPPTMVGPPPNSPSASQTQQNSTASQPIGGSGRPCPPQSGSAAAGAGTATTGAAVDGGTPRIANDPSLGTGQTVRTSPGIAGTLPGRSATGC